MQKIDYFFVFSIFSAIDVYLMQWFNLCSKIEQSVKGVNTWLDARERGMKNITNNKDNIVR